MKPASSSGALGEMHRHSGLKICLPHSGIVRFSDVSRDSVAGSKINTRSKMVDNVGVYVCDM